LPIVIDHVDINKHGCNGLL